MREREGSTDAAARPSLYFRHEARAHAATTHVHGLANAPLQQDLGCHVRHGALQSEGRAGGRGGEQGGRYVMRVIAPLPG